MIWARLALALWKPIAALLAMLGLYAKGRADARQKAALDAARDDLKAHERMNDAETGIGASDAERIKRLREFADRYGG